MNSHRSHRYRNCCLALAASLVALTGCQGLPGAASAATSNASSSVLVNGSLNFGTVAVGSSKTLSDTLANSTPSSLTISSISGLNSAFQITGLALPLLLAPGQTAPFSVQFQPGSAGEPSSTISFVGSNSLNYASLAVSGSAVMEGQLSSNPSSISFGNVQVGQSATLSGTLTVTGSSKITISNAYVVGEGFTVSGPALPLTISSSSSVAFKVTFSPTVSGAANATLIVDSNASNSTLKTTLSGTGGGSVSQGQLSVSPGTLGFGDVVVGGNAALNGSMTATGGPVTVNSASVNSSEFALSGITLPTTLKAGQTVPFTVTFAPQLSGAASGALSVSSNAANSPPSQTLTGDGTTAPVHSVDLDWDASTTSGVIGYNIYRGSVSGGPYAQVNASLDSSTAYTDDGVTAGTTYYYVVTAVDENSEESGYSNESKAVVPSP